MRAIVDRGTQVCVEAIAEVIAADTGADPERALLLASGLTGLAETSARWWLPRKGTVSRDEAVSASCRHSPGAVSPASPGSTATRTETH